MEIKKAIITSAGKATRMRPISNVIPKGLLPVFRNIEGKKYLKPIIDLILESLNSAGVRQMCLVVDVKSRLLIDYLFENDITFVFQKEPKGFGDAVMCGKEFIANEPFFVHTNDDFITDGYKEAVEVFKELQPDCLLFLSKVDNPQNFGIIEGKYFKDMHSHKIFKINGVEEKPQNPKSNLGIAGVYIFTTKIFDKLSEVGPDEKNEIQLTSGIQKLIQEDGKVYGMLLGEGSWLTVGNPENYFKTLTHSYNNL